MALTVEQMLYGVWCHSTLRTDIWYAAGNAGLVTVQKPTVTRTQLGHFLVKPGSNVHPLIFSLQWFLHTSRLATMKNNLSFHNFSVEDATKLALDIPWLDLIHPASPMHRATRWRQVCLSWADASTSSQVNPILWMSLFTISHRLSLVCQVFSWILELPTIVLASECVLHPFLWHDLAIAIFFLGSPSLEVFVLFFSVSPHTNLEVIGSKRSYALKWCKPFSDDYDDPYPVHHHGTCQNSSYPH